MKTTTKPPESGKGVTCLKPPLQQFWDLFNFPEPKELIERLPFRLCVVVDKALGPMHQRYDYVRDMGSAHIPHVFNGTPLPSGDLMFVFPDRWLGPVYARMFVHAMHHHPSFKKDKVRRKVLIVTHQPYIVSDCAREQVFVVGTDDHTPESIDTHLGPMPGVRRLNTMFD
jgi:hypothetical protein